MIDSNSGNRNKEKESTLYFNTYGLLVLFFFFNIIIVFEYYDFEQNMNHVRQGSLKLCITLMAYKPQARTELLLLLSSLTTQGLDQFWLLFYIIFEAIINPKLLTDTGETTMPGKQSGILNYVS